jgi:hypothetical protein
MNPIELLRGTHGPTGFRVRLPRIARAWSVALPLLAACADRPVTLPAPQAPPAQLCGSASLCETCRCRHRM